MLVTKGFISGAVFVVVGVAFLVAAYAGYDMGTAGRMGPGYFPVLCGASLAAVGLLSMITGHRESDARPGRIHLRPLLLVVLSLGGFALLADRAGMVISLGFAVFVVTLARRDISLPARLVLTAVVTTAAVLLFRVLLSVPIPVWPGM